MRKLIFFFLTVLLLLVPSKVIAQSSSSSADYVISRFETQITLNKDTSILVKETINVDFQEPKHGIFRIIPLAYTARGRTIKVGFDLISIEDEYGNSYKYSKSRLGQSVKLKIGDEEKTITGTHTYKITYQISKVLQRYDTQDEFYWNVTGAEWETEILSASALVESPHAEITQIDCFAGRLESQEKNCEGKFDDYKAEFITTSTLGYGKDFTIVVGLNKENELAFPGLIKRTLDSVFDNWGYLVAVIPALLMFYFWFKKGRDKRYLSENVYFKPEDVSERTVSLFERPHLPLVYHPINGLSPSEVGTIIDERVDIADVIAEILELARLGFIKIRKIEKKKIIGKTTEYAFIKTEKYDDQSELNKLKDYQKYLLKELFRASVVHKSVKEAEKLFEKHPKNLEEARKHLAKREYALLSALKNHFYEGLPVYKEKLYKRIENEKIFSGNPEKVRQTWVGIFLGLDFLALLAIIGFIIFTANIGPLLFLFVALIPGIIFALSMPRRTAPGYSLYRQIQGLKWYLEKGKWRYEVAENHLFIEEILPLAVSLGVVDRVVSDMKGLGISPPSYFVGTTAAAFTSDFTSFQRSSASSFLSSPQGKWTGASSWSGGSGFSGGGSVGGGFGGGGGGSW